MSHNIAGYCSWLILVRQHKKSDNLLNYRGLSLFFLRFCPRFVRHIKKAPRLLPRHETKRLHFFKCECKGTNYFSFSQGSSSSNPKYLSNISRNSLMSSISLRLPSSSANSLQTSFFNPSKLPFIMRMRFSMNGR